MRRVLLMLVLVSKWIDRVVEEISTPEGYKKQLVETLF